MAGGCATRLQVRGIDHQRIRRAALGCEVYKYLVEQRSDGFPTMLCISGTFAISAHSALTDEPIVDRFGWPILRWSVTPTLPVADYENDAADDPTAINPRHTMRPWKIRLNLAHLRLGQLNQVVHDNSSFASTSNAQCKKFNMP
jgi:hypothetical protein